LGLALALTWLYGFDLSPAATSGDLLMPSMHFDMHKVGHSSSPQTFRTGEVDVVVADAEDICLAAAASALSKFGFLAERIHEVENGDEAIVKLTALQTRQLVGKQMQDRQTPIILFLDLRSCGLDSARQICSLSSQGQLQREPFLVCVSARPFSNNQSASTAEQSYFHCSVPKTFEASRLRYCFELCQKWWLKGGGEPGRPIENSDPGAAKSMGPLEICQDSPFKVQTVPALPTTFDSQEVETRGGNKLKCLDHLRPPRPPFEDVEMICLVGCGSFGRVYRARWGVSPVALKVVEHYEQGKPAVMTFEGALSASLAHPNLVQTFKYSIRETRGARKDDGSHTVTESKGLSGYEVWIVQEWCSLGTLNQMLCRKKILEQGGFGEVIEVCTEIASAASYLHGRGIIHGDLTASNVLLVERSCPKGYITKVSDFGLARVLDNGASGIQTATMGTVTYMPPELFQLEGCALTKKVDVYAFGVIMWQLCTGETPFEGLQPTQVVVMVAQGATLELPHKVPESLHRVFNQSIARKPDQRPGFDSIVHDLLIMANLNSPDEGEH